MSSVSWSSRRVAISRPSPTRPRASTRCGGRRGRRIEPSRFTDAHKPLYGSGADARLLAGIMGHNLCLDIFGGPSDEEAAAGVTAHGEASVARYQIDASAETLTMSATLPLAQIVVRRRIDLEGRRVRVRESVENLAGMDRPIGWTQHVTLGPPYLEQGTTEFHLPATRSKVFDGTFGPADNLKAGAEFESPARAAGRWWHAQSPTGHSRPDLERLQRASARPSAQSGVVCGVLAGGAARLRVHVAPRRFSVGRHLGRKQQPHPLAVERADPFQSRGFGVSPFPESRREMVARGRLFGEPTFRWLPAKQTIEVEYRAVLHPAGSIQPLTTLA